MEHPESQAYWREYALQLEDESQQLRSALKVSRDAKKNWQGKYSTLRARLKRGTHKVKGCLSKTKFESREEAQVHLQVHRRERDLYTYPCPHCGGHHLSTKSK